MTTIALVVQQGFGCRVLLQTQVLETLMGNGNRVVVLTSDPETVARYLNQRGLSEIDVVPLNMSAYGPLRNNRMGRFFRNLRLYAIRTRTVDDHFEMAWKDALASRSLLQLCELAMIKGICTGMRLHKAFTSWIIRTENRLFAPRIHDRFFQTYHPDILVVTSLGTFDDDHLIIREAKLSNVPVVSFILSWDNTTVRGLGINLSDHIIVWSKIMKNELIRLHNLPADIISVDGVPHFDCYVNGRRSILTKSKLAGRFKFGASKKLLFLGTRSPNSFLYNADIARVICEAICDGRLPEESHLLVRLHPIYFRKANGKYQFGKDLREWDELLGQYGERCLSLNRPAMIDGKINFFMPDSEIQILASILDNSDVVVNMFSTLNLEACILDKPIINIAFQFDGKKPEGSKKARFNIAYDEVQTHNQRIVRSNGTVLARSVDELVLQTRSYLQQPEMHRTGRKKIVDNECGMNLGRAGQAVGNRILSVAKQLSVVH